MRIVADIHNHSRFSRACSPQLTIPNLDLWAQKKGVNLITVADFTHPIWIDECERDLIEDGDTGFYFYRHGGKQTRFMFTTELSFVYKRHGKTRRVHNIVCAPNLAAVKKLNSALEKKDFNLKSDGRPILGMACRDFLEFAKGIDSRIEVIPAHIWTPWFAIFGSKSGYDSIEECYGDMSQYIFALETGLSSDPMMNYQVSALDPYLLISNSDSHSLKNIARECNVFEIPDAEVSYDEFMRILKEKDITRFLYTIEFYPEEGRYHYDGHRECEVILNPQQTQQHNGVCPVCQKPLTIGVENRVFQLADRAPGFVLANRPDHKKLIELDKIIAESFGLKSRTSKKVLTQYDQLLDWFGTELDILMHISYESLCAKGISPLLAEAIIRARTGNVRIKPGYDGEYGHIEIFTAEERVNKTAQQRRLF